MAGRRSHHAAEDCTGFGIGCFRGGCFGHGIHHHCFSDIHQIRLNDENFVDGIGHRSEGHRNLDFVPLPVDSRIHLVQDLQIVHNHSCSQYSDVVGPCRIGADRNAKPDWHRG